MNIFSLAASRAAANAVNEQLHKPRRGDGKTVHLPKLILIIGIVSTTVFLIPTCILFYEKDFLLSLGFLAFSLFCSSLIIAYINQRIYYDAEGFTAKSFFGIKRRYSYTDIEYITGNVPHNIDIIIDDENYEDIDAVLEFMSEDTKLTAKGKKIMIDQSAVGGLEFLAFAQKQYKKFNGGRPIPRNTKKSKCDAIFNGNVKNPLAHIIVDIVVTIPFVLMVVIVPITNVPTAMEDLELKAVTVQSYTADEEYLDLQIDGFETEPYLRGYKETVADTEKLLTLLDSNGQVKIGYKTFVDDGVTEYRVEYLEDENGTVYTTPEDFHVFYQKDFKSIMIVLVAFLLIWIAYVVFSIYVGRNPHKFSKKFVHKFFKEGTIRL
ncbi:MAG: hypothetical protein IJ447_01445 [Clostridia bacterium]|nr:hypothetical protein [Clostridia bacterium]